MNPDRNTLHRFIILVPDGLGVGALPDAGEYGDAGANTLAHVVPFLPAPPLPCLVGLGLGNVEGAAPLPGTDRPRAAWGRAAEASPAKDTTIGHWELAGLPTPEPFALFPEGFPPEILGPFEEYVGRQVLGNRPASGTAIIEELGAEHLATGRPIVYTSADSVFQVACHTGVVFLETLYDWCRKAREITAPRRVGRVIARPFEGEPGAFRRTADRHDYSLPPPGPTLLARCRDAGLEAVGVGKIGDIFAGVGLTRSLPTRSDEEGLDRLEELLGEEFGGLVFVNLVEFDMLYGHRRDPEGYARHLAWFDARLPGVLGRLRPGDLLVLAADHGCDPTHAGTDHTREHVPLLACGPAVRPAPLGTRRTFADVAETGAAWLGLAPFGTGESFLKAISG